MGGKTVSEQLVYSVSDDKNCIQEAKHCGLRKSRGGREQMLMNSIQDDPGEFEWRHEGGRWFRGGNSQAQRSWRW